MDQTSDAFQDQTVTCRDCGQEFVFSAGEQAFYAEKGFAVPPKRCKSCRERRKTDGPGGGGAPGGWAGGGGSRPGRSSTIEVEEKPARTFRPRDGGGPGAAAGGGSRARFDVKCSECGAQTTVPFEPAEGRPVFCRNCYQKRRR